MKPGGLAVFIILITCEPGLRVGEINYQKNLLVYEKEFGVKVRVEEIEE